MMKTYGTHDKEKSNYGFISMLGGLCAPVYKFPFGVSTLG